MESINPAKKAKKHSVRISVIDELRIFCKDKKVQPSFFSNARKPNYSLVLPFKDLKMELFEDLLEKRYYAQIILPMATPKPYTYHFTEGLLGQVRFGVRVEVQFGIGRDLYSALVVGVMIGRGSKSFFMRPFGSEWPSMVRAPAS